MVATQNVRAIIDRVIKSSMVAIIHLVASGCNLFPQNLQYLPLTGRALPLVFTISGEWFPEGASWRGAAVFHLNHLFTLLSFFRISLISCQ